MRRYEQVHLEIYCFNHQIKNEILVNIYYLDI